MEERVIRRVARGEGERKGERKIWGTREGERREKRGWHGGMQKERRGEGDGERKWGEKKDK